MGLSNECLFCGQDPCVCNEPVTPKRKSKRSSIGSAKISKPLVPAEQPKPARQGLDSSMTDEELEYRAAIRALASILNPDERFKVSAILDTPETKAEKVFAWKMMHREEVRRRNDS